MSKRSLQRKLTGTARTASGHYRAKRHLGAALPRKADMRCSFYHVRFSNRPFEVKRFQTIHHDSVDVAHGLVLLFGIGTKALPSWDSRRGGTIFGAALPLDER